MRASQESGCSGGFAGAVIVSRNTRNSTANSAPQQYLTRMIFPAIVAPWISSEPRSGIGDRISGYFCAGVVQRQNVGFQPRRCGFNSYYPCHAPLDQLDRSGNFYFQGSGFESSVAHHHLPTRRVPLPDHQIAGPYRRIRAIFRQSPRMGCNGWLRRDAVGFKASVLVHASAHG